MSIDQCRLLLVEPDSGDAELARRILTQALEGCQVFVAPDAISFARYFADGGFSAVISELDLGWSSGAEILSSFAKRHPGVRLILFSRKLPPNIESLRNKIGLAGYAEKSGTGFLKLPELATAAFEEETSHDAGEVLWSQAVQQLEEPSLTVLKDGRILESNRAATRVFGYSKPDDLLGLKLSDLFDSNRSLQGEEDFLRQLRALGPEGPMRLELMAAPARDPLRVGRKRIVGWLIPNSSRVAIVYHTLTHSGEGLSAAGDEDHSKAYAELLYAVSHDLQEPLQLISRYAKILQDTYSTEVDSSGVRFIDNLVTNSRQLQSMLDDLLEFSRLGRMAPMLNEVDLNAIVGEVVAMFQPRLAELAGQIRWTGLPKIVADRGQMVRLFQNLIGNAIKFHGDDALDVHIAAHREGRSFELIVEDNGIGVDLSNTDAIFGMFRRLHTQDEHPGTGMGLALCRRIVSLHGGKIWAKPREKPQQGMAVHFTLSMDGPQGDEPPGNKIGQTKAAS